MRRVLEDKAAVITGANQGLGLEIARKYIEAGANVTICARNGTLLNKAKQQLERILSPGQQLLAQKADVSSAADVDNIVEATLEKFGRLDILVNNAGVYGPKGAMGTHHRDQSLWFRSNVPGRFAAFQGPAARKDRAVVGRRCNESPAQN